MKTKLRLRCSTVCAAKGYIYTCSKNDKGNKMILVFLLYVMSSQIDVEDIYT